MFRMLNDQEKDFARDLLCYLADDDLLSLANTSTNNIIVPRDREEAILAILLHTESLDVLLNRKKVSRDTLFKYLHDKRKDAAPSQDKRSLCNIILDYWASDFEPRNVAIREQGSCSTSRFLPSEPVTSALVPETQSNLNFNRSGTENDFPVQDFALQFVDWFFKMLNEGQDIRTEHFWEDSAAQVTAGSCINHADGAQGVTVLLNGVRNLNNLLFNPNVSSMGVKGYMDCHGLAVVLACGTLHQGTRCVGIFEQIFALARDPMSENNWKVKKTHMVLHNKDHVACLPVLEDSQLALEYSQQTNDLTE